MPSFCYFRVQWQFKTFVRLSKCQILAIYDASNDLPSSYPQTVREFSCLIFTASLKPLKQFTCSYFISSLNFIKSYDENTTHSHINQTFLAKALTCKRLILQEKLSVCHEFRVLGHQSVLITKWTDREMIIEPRG